MKEVLRCEIPASTIVHEKPSTSYAFDFLVDNNDRKFSSPHRLERGISSMSSKIDEAIKLTGNQEIHVMRFALWIVTRSAEQDRIAFAIGSGYRSVCHTRKKRIG